MIKVGKYHDRWTIAVKQNTFQDNPYMWVAWAVMGLPLNGTNPLEELSAEVWLQYGATKNEAVDKLKLELDKENELIRSE